jgi:hypothetical protein
VPAMNRWGWILVGVAWVVTLLIFVRQRGPSGIIFAGFPPTWMSERTGQVIVWFGLSVILFGWIIPLTIGIYRLVFRK